MNLKKQISKFRSEILIGEYESAISISKGIMTQLEVLMALKIIKDDRLYNYIQQEYEKCLSIKNFIHNQIRSTDQPSIKKWGNKQTSKWKKKEEPIKMETNQEEFVAKECEKQCTSPIKMLINDHYIDLLQKIERQVMMPIKMPTFFKGHSNCFKLIVVPEESYANLLTYFIENDFMSIEYEAFEYEFNKSAELNYFYENHIAQILIDCKYMQRQQINLSKEKRNINNEGKINCIFISISQGSEYLII